MPWPSRHISVAIRRTPREVVAFAGDPQNLPRWAAGLATGVRGDGDAWVADSPMGRVVVRFAPRNEFGVLDHDVTLPSGEVVHNPLRVLANGDGAEVVFTLYKRPGMTDETFEADAALVSRDLRALKALLEA